MMVGRQYRWMLWTLTMACCLFAVVRADTGDTMLTAYWLSTQQEGSFSATDGVISSFWAEWSGRDSMQLDPATNSYAGRDQWDGQSDASVMAKAAGGTGGLYLLLVVSDDTWVDTATGGWEADHLRLYVDSLPSSAIADCLDCYLMAGSRLTYTTEHLRFWLGEGGAPDVLRYLTYEPAFLGLCNRQCSFAVAAESLGIAVEAVAERSGSVALEIRVSWHVFSVRACQALSSWAGGLVPSIGARRAFCVTYSDVDSAGQPPLTSWLSSAGRDPWSCSAQCWGDIEFGPGFPPVPTPVESLLAVGPRPQAGAVLRARGDAVRYYTLMGERVHAVTLGPRAPKAVLVRRTASDAGLLVSRP